LVAALAGASVTAEGRGGEQVGPLGHNCFQRSYSGAGGLGSGQLQCGANCGGQDADSLDEIKRIVNRSRMIRTGCFDGDFCAGVCGRRLTEFVDRLWWRQFDGSHLHLHV
jgi:hypothetical protein